MKKFTITITSHSTGGNSTKDYHSQFVEIMNAPDEREAGVDGHVSSGRQNIRVFWQGGKAEDLKNVISVTLLDENRGLAFEGALTTAVTPQETADGIEFFLVRLM